jgi:hypothetical protein
MRPPPCGARKLHAASRGNNQRDGHPLLANPVETDRRPAALDASDDGGPVGHDGDLITITHQHIPRVHPKSWCRREPGWRR